MIILDTNVLSTLMRRSPDTSVTSWLDKVAASLVWTTAINVYELRYGIEILAPGRRRGELQATLERLLSQALEGRVLAFDGRAAEAAAAIGAVHHRAGRNVEIRDLEIAGIAASQTATLATRNIKDFDGIGLSLVNPWAAEHAK